MQIVARICQPDADVTATAIHVTSALRPGGGSKRRATLIEIPRKVDVAIDVEIIARIRRPDAHLPAALDHKTRGATVRVQVSGAVRSVFVERKVARRAKVRRVHLRPDPKTRGADAEIDHLTMRRRKVQVAGRVDG